MKYIDAEKLKAHIQYLIKKDNYELFDVPELLSFIDSLQQEQPSEDLEEAAEEYATTHLRNNEFPTADSAFIAGAKWMEKEINKELIKFAEKRKNNK